MYIGEDCAKTIYHALPSPELESISIATLPDKVEYEIGEEFDKTGLTVTKMYTDESTETYIPEYSEITGFDSSEPGEKTLVITCSDTEMLNATVSTSFTVTVKAPVNPDPEVDPGSNSNL